MISLANFSMIICCSFSVPYPVSIICLMELLESDNTLRFSTSVSIKWVGFQPGGDFTFQTCPLPHTNEQVFRPP